MSMPYEECPQFEGCSVNRCPLDPAVEVREQLANDPETRCGTRRSTRERIAAKYVDILPWQGLTPREQRKERARARWLALPDEERARRVARLESARSLIRKDIVKNPSD